MKALFLSLLVFLQLQINLYDARSRRQGYAVVNPKSGTVDIYDTLSRRQGYGVISGGTLQMFTPGSQRTTRAGPLGQSGSTQAPPATRNGP
jgi:hypothetical protein